MKRSFYTWSSVLVLMTLALAACAGGATTTQAPPPESTLTTEPAEAEAPVETEAPSATEVPITGGVMLPEVDPAAVSGEIISAGSSTVYPLAEAMVQRFKDEGFSGNITIDSVGTGGGFERFCVNGETDIANASRPIKDSEIESCHGIGREPIEFRVGTDALAVVVSSENDFLTDISLEDLARIFSPDAVQWSDINPEWPAEDIQRFAPGTDSGTFDFFVEFVMLPVYGDENDAATNAILSAENTQFSEDDNVLVQGVEGSPYSIGFFGYAYYQENADRLKILSVNSVEPSFETAESGDYPLSRPLFIYSDGKILQEKPQVAAFINFFLTYVNEEIEAVGYFPASEDAINTARASFIETTQ